MAPSKQEGIKVTVRFRPMNKVERDQVDNTVVTKISTCGRACELTKPDMPDKPQTYYFDTIYGPASTQEDVYEYSGKPLVEAMKKGYNSTIFAYGQTGSGKTWSMMGTITGPMRGLQPRIIEDVYDYIENDAPKEDQYTVQISMCEIYMERVKDLFNPMEDNMKIKESPDKGIYVDGITEQHCASTQEVLDAMETGFMNRATSATKQNAESSRSHCVTILKVTCHKPDGSKTTSKIKMVDLAGSEKTRKTEAVGQRLKEAQCINQSLTALSQVLNALCTTGPDGFVPYRNSKLTRILQDALGGNSKTSLIVAASPCSFNVEETISALRFGERAKKVKCKAVINKQLSPSELGKQVTRLEKEVEILTYDNELLKAREEVLFAFLTERGHNGEDIVKDVSIDGEEEKDAELGDLAFNQVSSECLVIDKKTGRVVAGNADALAASKLATRTREAKDAERKRLEALENERIAVQAAALIRRGDYNGLAHVLEGKVALGGGASQQAFDELEDNLADLRAELRGADALNEQLEDQFEAMCDKNADLGHEMSVVKSKLAEYRFYKQKVEFLEKESEMQVRRLKTQGSIMMEDEPVDIDFDMDSLGEMSAAARQKMELLAKAVVKKDSMIVKLRSEGTLNTDELIDALKGSGTQAEALKKILNSNKTAQIKLREAEVKAEKAQRAAAMLTKRDTFNQDLQANWKNQLKQMEKAVLMCSEIHKRDRKKYTSEIAQKDEQISKLKLYIERQTQIRSRPKQSIFGPGKNRIKNAIGASRTSTRKKRRPAKVTSLTQDATAVAQN